MSAILKYLDCFGTNFTFYTERNRKFYTQLGGILTLLAIFFGIIVFFYINLDEFLRYHIIFQIQQHQRIKKVIKM